VNGLIARITSIMKETEGTFFYPVTDRVDRCRRLSWVFLLQETVTVLRETVTVRRRLGGQPDRDTPRHLVAPRGGHAPAELRGGGCSACLAAAGALGSSWPVLCRGRSGACAAARDTRASRRGSSDSEHPVAASNLLP
jgi:hypothetical protein